MENQLTNNFILKSKKKKNWFNKILHQVRPSSILFKHNAVSLQIKPKIAISSFHNVCVVV